MQPHADTPLPVVKLDANRIAPRHQFEVWHESTAPLFDTGRVGEGPFCAGATCYLADTLLFTRVHFGRMRFRRERRHLCNAESDSITLQFYRSGSINGQLEDGTPLQMGSDRISLHDFSHCYTGIGESSEQYGVVIPRHLVPRHDRIRRRCPMFSWPLDSPAGRLLIAALTQVWQELPRASLEDATALSGAFIGLLNGLLATTPSTEQRPDIERAGLLAMERYVRAELHRPDLGVDDLCRVFNCSRPTLYRLFRPHGGVKAYLREQRLGHCFRALAVSGGRQRGRVSQVAERWGFADLSRFHRLFRQRYGMTPGDVMALSETTAGAARHGGAAATWHSDVERLRSWLERF
jgi:AraC-like DNA-binding protein